MKALVKARYYWPTWSRDIAQYINNCMVCKHTKEPRDLPPGLLQLLLILEYPWQHINIDFRSFLKSKVFCSSEVNSYETGECITVSSSDSPITLTMVPGGVHLWRGYFNSSADGLYLEVQGGIAHSWTAWLNRRLVGSLLGNISSSIGADELMFPEEAVTDGRNVLLAMQNNTGHKQLSASLNVRGIQCHSPKQESLGPVHTHYNEGGLRVEHLGWHLAGVDDSDWPRGAPSDGFEGAGVKFYPHSSSAEPTQRT
ncbi:hypothetical protein BDV12DRAFT_193302 [Aspergillus spectabilis]